MKHISKRYSIMGVSLVELMIAIVISATLLIGVGNIYSTSRRTYSVDDEFARLQENARVAMNHIITQIRMAGYVGCAKNFNLNFNNFLNTTGDTDNDVFLTDIVTGIRGYEANTSGPGNTVDLNSVASGWLGGTIPPLVTGMRAGSDVLIVRRANSRSSRLPENKHADYFWIEDLGSDVTTSGSAVCHMASNICEGDILLATDCSKSRLFQVSAGMARTGNKIKLQHDNSGMPGNASTSWGGATNDVHYFDPNETEIMKIEAFAYYIGTGASGEPALFRQSAVPGVAAEELVEGIENIQVLYGIDSDKTAGTDGDGIANRYVTADQVVLADDNVVSIRLSVLVRSKLNIPGRPVTSGNHDVGGTTLVNVADARLRRAYTTIIKVRNKGL